MSVNKQRFEELRKMLEMGENNHYEMRNGLIYF